MGQSRAWQDLKLLLRYGERIDLSLLRELGVDPEVPVYTRLIELSDKC